MRSRCRLSISVRWSSLRMCVGESISRTTSSRWLSRSTALRPSRASLFGKIGRMSCMRWKHGRIRWMSSVDSQACILESASIGERRTRRIAMHRSRVRLWRFMNEQSVRVIRAQSGSVSTVFARATISLNVVNPKQDNSVSAADRAM